MIKNKKQVKFTIGLVGPICAGKETVGEYLERKYKATTYSLSDVIREELNFLGFDRHSRDLLQAIGNELRYHRGPDYLARKIVDKLKARDHGFTVVGSIRNPEEVHYLRENLPNFCLLSIDASQKVRFQRMKKRSRKGDPEIWEEFLEAEAREFDQKTKELFQIQVDIASEQADFFVDNGSDKKTLFKNIDLLITKTLRPSIRNRLNNLTVAVGSKNPTKISAVRSVMEKIFPNAKIIGTEVNSGVPDTLFSDEEAITGATNRAKQALKEIKADLAVGLEGGIKQLGKNYFLTNWAVVANFTGKIGIGGGSEVPIPEKLVSEIKKEPDLGKIVDKLIGSKNIKTQMGTSGVLTKGLVHRFNETEIAVSAALASFLSPEFYDKGK